MATHALPPGERTAMRRDERIGLALAIGLHAALLAALLFGRHEPAPLPPPERVSVTISDEAAPTSTAPRPAAQPAAAVAPTIGEPAPPTPMDAQPQPAPQKPAPPAPTPPAPTPPTPTPPAPSVRQPEPHPPQPRARPIARPQPAAKAPAPRAPAPPTRAPATPAPPRPAPRPAARPAATPPRQAARPSTAPARPSAAPARPATRPSGARSPTSAATAPKQAGASRIGADFLKGVANAPATAARGQPAASIGPAERASLSSSIARQLKPNWTAPQGADAELLVTVLTWDLDAGGKLKGRPRVVSQRGITDSNRAQAARHAEQAIRAVELAAPFNLPAQYYAAWRHVTAFSFDRRLSQ